MEEFKAGDKVKYRGMTMPAEIISGPHRSPGRPRYLLRKADGNVSLVSVAELERVVPRAEKVAGTLAVNLFSRPFVTLDSRTQTVVLAAAVNALRIADATRDQR